MRRIFAFEEDGRLVQHEGGYTDYANRKRTEEAKRAAASGSGSRTRSDGAAEGNAQKCWKSGQKRKLKFSYQEQKDYESIEGELEKLLEEKMNRWMYLEELAAKIESGETAP